LIEGGIKTQDVEMDVLIAETVEIYWPRCEAFDTVLDISFSRPSLDGEASAFLNDLYEEQGVSEVRMAWLLTLFVLEFSDPTLMRPNIQGHPVYLGLAMTANNRVRLKPQSLSMNLPYNQSM
jgi:hypothetical protein